MVAVVVSKDDVVGVTVTVLVLVDGGGTTAVVVTVVTLLVVVVDDVVVDDVVAEPEAAVITPQAIRLLSPVDPAVRSSAVWWTTSEEPELFRRSAAVTKFVVVTSFAEPSDRTCKAVRSPLAGKPVWSGAWYTLPADSKSDGSHLPTAWIISP